MESVCRKLSSSVVVLVFKPNDAKPVPGNLLNLSAILGM